MKAITTTLAFVALSLLFFAPLQAAAAKPDEMQALREEVQALARGQEQMQKDLAEIKTLLEQRARPAPGRPAFQPTDFTVGDSPALGAATAPVTLVEFSDYQCPFCKRHATTVMPDIIKEFVDTGKVRIVMREFPIENLHKDAKGAALAALCTREQGKYWQMHDVLFANQKALLPDDLKNYAATLGMDTVAFNRCLDEGKYAKQVAASIAEGQKLGISGTPSFVAGLTDKADPGKVRLTRFIRGAQPLSSFQQNLNELLQEAGKAK